MSDTTPPPRHMTSERRVASWAMSPRQMADSDSRFLFTSPSGTVMTGHFQPNAGRTFAATIESVTTWMVAGAIPATRPSMAAVMELVKRSVWSILSNMNLYEG